MYPKLAETSFIYTCYLFSQLRHTSRYRILSSILEKTGWSLILAMGGIGDHSPLVIRKTNWTWRRRTSKKIFSRRRRKKKFEEEEN